MDPNGLTRERCPHCGARARTGDAWCTLCLQALDGGSPAAVSPAPAPAAARPPTPPAPVAEPPAPSLPVQRRGPADPNRPLVGGTVDEQLLARLTDSLAAEVGGGTPRWERPWLSAVLWTGVLLVVLLTGMVVAGRLL